jgi:hypothetical protein
MVAAGRESVALIKTAVAQIFHRRRTAESWARPVKKCEAPPKNRVTFAANDDMRFIGVGNKKDGSISGLSKLY